MHLVLNGREREESRGFQPWNIDIAAVVSIPILFLENIQTQQED